MIIDAFITPYFAETENVFNESIVVMIDVFRAGSTIAAALYNGAKEIITCETLDKAVTLYNTLSRESRFLGGERNGIKPNGFDAGNSPAEYSNAAVHSRTIILTTSNGTKIFAKAKDSRMRIIGGFVNLSAVLSYIYNIIEASETPDIKLIFICAGNNGRLSYEDTLCAGCYINSFKKQYPDVEMSDSAHAAKNLYNLHSVDLNQFIKSREHAVLLTSLGFFDDIETCLSFDIFPVVPIISGSIVKIG